MKESVVRKERNGNRGCVNPALDFVWEHFARHLPPGDAPKVTCDGCGRAMPVAGGKATRCAIESAWSRSFPSRNPEKSNARLGSPTNIAFAFVSRDGTILSSSARTPHFPGLEEMEPGPNAVRARIRALLLDPPEPPFAAFCFGASPAVGMQVTLSLTKRSFVLTGDPAWATRIDTQVFAAFVTRLDRSGIPWKKLRTALAIYRANIVATDATAMAKNAKTLGKLVEQYDGLAALLRDWPPKHSDLDVALMLFGAPPKREAEEAQTEAELENADA